MFSPRARRKIYGLGREPYGVFPTAMRGVLSSFHFHTFFA